MDNFCNARDNRYENRCHKSPDSKGFSRETVTETRDCDNDCTSPILDTESVRKRGRLRLSRKSNKNSIDLCLKRVKEQPECRNVENFREDETNIDSDSNDNIPSAFSFTEKQSIAGRSSEISNSRDDVTSETNRSKSLLNRLQEIKRKKCEKFEGRISTSLRDENIPIDEFTKTLRELDRVPCSEKPTKAECNSSGSLGLVSFGTFLKLSSPGGKDPTENRQPVTHLSFDEDKEEDMFAETKDDSKAVAGFGNQDDSSECSLPFHGFSSSESELSKEIALRCSQREEIEKLENYEADEESFKGFSVVEKADSLRFKNTWNRLSTMYQRESSFDTSNGRTEKKTCDPAIEKDTDIHPRIRELKNLGCAKREDKKFKNVVHGLRKNVISSPVESIGKSNVPRPGKRKNIQDTDDSMIIDSHNSCSFSTASGVKLSISEEAISRARQMYKEIESLDGNNGNKNKIIENKENVSCKRMKENIMESPRMKVEPEFEKENNLAFKTARGSELKISKDALIKAQARFEEIKMDIAENSIEPVAPIKNETPVKLALSNVRESLETRANDTGIGFTTARGCELKVSKEALLKAQAQFDQVEVEAKEKLTNNDTRRSSESDKHDTTLGFATAGGRQIEISEKALSKTKAIFDEIENEYAMELSQMNPNVASVSAKASAALEKNLPMESLNFESLDFEDFLVAEKEATNKRKFEDVDEDTPMRKDQQWKRKKGRCVSDVQGRKLFNENSKNSSNPNEYPSPISECRKNPISDEIQESTAALIEDEECSRETNKPRSPSTGALKCDEKKIEIQAESIPDDLNFDSQFSEESQHSKVIDTFIMETIKIMEARLSMTSKQDETIRSKRRNKPQACDGSLYRLRSLHKNLRYSWRQLTEGKAPVPRVFSGKAMDSEALAITANSAASYVFSCADFYGGKDVRINVEGIKVGDEAFLILDERNCAGVREFERAFLASPGVDPNLVPAGWVKNHYRWIVWKLASMDRVSFGQKCLPRMLTPNRIMLELKYRYDREIYRSQWPPLRRIMEKNEDAGARLVLCVASIIKEVDDKTPIKGSSSTPGTSGSIGYKMELTDGWYSIYASIDAAMMNYIKSGKIKEGTKLVTFGARAMNLDQGCSVLEIPEAVTLRIHTNSTRRVRWDTKLDFCHSYGGPMTLSLKSVKANGGPICKVVVAVARIYPILYREKLPDGQFIFRNARCDDEAARAYEMHCQSKIEEICEKARADFQPQSDTNNQEEEIRRKIASKLRECLPPPRDVTPVLKIRIADEETSAMMTIWSTEKDFDKVLEEGSSIIIYNGFASGQRCNELQITAGRSTIIDSEVSRRIAYSERVFTSLTDIGESGFNPVYGEFDTIGIVASIGAAPHGMKNFETVNLSCPRNNNTETSDFLSILFWQGVSTHGYSKILTVGTLVACSNLEWRRNTSRGLPTAYCNERSIFTKTPRQKHLAKPSENLCELIKDPLAYATHCATIIREETAKRTSLRTPGSGTPSRIVTGNNSTPVWSPRDSSGSIDVNCTPKNNSRKASIMRRIEKLETYREPPKLPPIVITNNSPKVSSDFLSPVVTPVTKS